MAQFFDPDGTVAGLKKCLEQGCATPGTTGLLVLCADGNNFSPEIIDPTLKACSLPLGGGIFPGIIFNGKMYRQGSLIICLDDILAIQTISGLSNPVADFEEIIENQISESDELRTLILFVDGFATRISSFIEGLFNIFGLDINYVGGGAGSLSMERRPYLITQEGLVEDCAVLTFLRAESGIGVCHGWEELCGPYQVTSANANVIHTLEWQPAFDIYKEALNYEAANLITQNDFYQMAQRFPFGIGRLDGEQVVRDPTQVLDDGSIVCIGEVQTGSFVSILKSDSDQLIKAAAESLQRAKDNYRGNHPPKLHFFVDCISRTIVLGDRFSEEVDAVKDEHIPLSGICSIGEIANSGTDFLEFYNMTSVMAVLE